MLLKLTHWAFKLDVDVNNLKEKVQIQCLEESSGVKRRQCRTQEELKRCDKVRKRWKEQRHKERVRGKRAIICLSGLITIRLKPDSERKTERRTERDGVLVEVNISQRGYNDRCELGVGLWDCGHWEIEEEEWSRRVIKTRERWGGKVRGEMKTEREKKVTREARSGKTCLKNAPDPPRERQRKKSLTQKALTLFFFSAH